MPHVRIIGTHVRPHFDELAAIWILKRFGEEDFPGVSTAQVVFVGSDSIIKGQSPEEAEQNGILLIGIGGGKFDEHPKDGVPRKKGECAATLVAKELAIESRPELAKLLEFSRKNDVQGVYHPFDLASMAKLMNNMYPENPSKVLEWIFLGLDAKYREQLQFFGTTLEEFGRRATLHLVQGPRGESLRLFVIRSDDEQISKYARWELGGNAAIVIQLKSKGHVQIYTNRKYGLKLHEVAQLLRTEEQQRKKKVVTTDWKALASEGTGAGAEEWYYHKNAEMLLNGSLTSPNVRPTRISPNRIVELVRIGINPNMFEQERAGNCTKGICASTKENPCPWYRYGLHRCRFVRYQARQGALAN